MEPGIHHFLRIAPIESREKLAVNPLTSKAQLCQRKTPVQPSLTHYPVRQENCRTAYTSMPPPQLHLMWQVPHRTRPSPGGGGITGLTTAAAKRRVPTAPGML